MKEKERKNERVYFELESTIKNSKKEIGNINCMTKEKEERIVFGNANAGT